MLLANKYLLDTNVMYTADKHPVAESGEREELSRCAEMSFQLIKNVIQTKEGLVLDDGWEILGEYAKNVDQWKPSGIARAFFIWLHNNRLKFPSEDRVHITPSENGYAEFPDLEEFTNFDPSDKKFVAVAYAHAANPKPTIYVSDDSKWQWYSEGFSKAGIKIEFLDDEYADNKAKKKSKGKRG